MDELGNELLLQAKDDKIVRLERVISDLKEQLDMARTKASDLEEFRERERRHAESVAQGMSMAIGSMILALKGGKP